MSAKHDDPDCPGRRSLDNDRSVEAIRSSRIPAPRGGGEAQVWRPRIGSLTRLPARLGPNLPVSLHFCAVDVFGATMRACAVHCAGAGASSAVRLVSLPSRAILVLAVFKPRSEPDDTNRHRRQRTFGLWRTPWGPLLDAWESPLVLSDDDGGWRSRLVEGASKHGPGTSEVEVWVEVGSPPPHREREQAFDLRF